MKLDYQQKICTNLRDKAKKGSIMSDNANENKNEAPTPEDTDVGYYCDEKFPEPSPRNKFRRQRSFSFCCPQTEEEQKAESNEQSDMYIHPSLIKEALANLPLAAPRRRTSFTRRRIARYKRRKSVAVVYSPWVSPQPSPVETPTPTPGRSPMHNKEKEKNEG